MVHVFVSSELSFFLLFQLCRPKAKSLVVFGLNETLVREEVVDALLREVGIDPKVVEESVRLSHSIASNSTDHNDAVTSSTAGNLISTTYLFLYGDTDLLV